jgi:hypothetical protein
MGEPCSTKRGSLKFIIKDYIKKLRDVTLPMTRKMISFVLPGVKQCVLVVIIDVSGQNICLVFKDLL